MDNDFICVKHGEDIAILKSQMSEVLASLKRIEEKHTKERIVWESLSYTKTIFIGFIIVFAGAITWFNQNIGWILHWLKDPTP